MPSNCLKMTANLFNLTILNVNSTILPYINKYKITLRRFNT